MSRRWTAIAVIVSLPALVNGLGGRAKMIERLRLVALDMKIDGVRMTEILMKTPSDLVPRDVELFAVVPFDMKLTVPGGAVGRKPRYLIAVSGDRGRTWQFLDGDGIGGDREKLRTILPRFPEGLELPPRRRARWEKSSAGKEK